MAFPVQITFRHLDHSKAVESRILKECASLRRYFPRIIRARVVISVPHHHQKHGEGFHVAIRISVPRSEIIVNHEPALDTGPLGEGPEHIEMPQQERQKHDDLYIVIGDAFAIARRQLEDYARLLRGDIKAHAAPAFEDEKETPELPGHPLIPDLPVAGSHPKDKRAARRGRKQMPI